LESIVGIVPSLGDANATARVHSGNCCFDRMVVCGGDAAQIGETARMSVGDADGRQVIPRFHLGSARNSSVSIKLTQWS
jgi:hypothetical protein